MFGIILYDIPIIITLEKLRKISSLESFIPKYNKKNMRIAFSLCESKEERKDIYNLALEIDLLVKCTDFKPQQSLIKMPYPH